MMSSKENNYTDSTLSQRIHGNIKNLWRDKCLCDFQIHIGRTVFPVHKLLLAACSDYFRGLFAHDSLEAKENKVVLEDISEIAMKEILNFCYTSNVCLDVESVQEVLSAASRLQVYELVQICSNFIQDRIDIDNCIGVLTVADRHNLTTCRENALCFCLDKFSEIASHEQFEELDDTLLASMLAHDQLNITDEKDVFNSIMKWVAGDVETRRPKLVELMKHVRFPLMSPLTLIELSMNELILDSPKCRDIIDEAKNYLLLNNYPDQRQRASGPRFHPRTPLRQMQRIYAVGGWTNEYRSIPSVEKYDPYSNTWVEVKPMIKPRCGVGVTIIGNSLYVVGGHDGQRYLKSAERYDIATDTWHEDIPAMNSERTSVGVVTLNGYIYAVGGQIGSCSSGKVERYDPKSKEWVECKPLTRKRLGAGVTVLDGLIYVVGGADQLDVLDTVECYDPELDEWHQLSSMSSKRKHLGCTSYAGQIYVVGGRGEDCELNTAERYDPKTDTWENLTPMSEKRSGAGLIQLDGMLYAAGGHNGDIRLKLVEAFDPVTMTWTTKNPMIYERLGGGFAVYSPCITDVTNKI